MWFRNLTACFAHVSKIAKIQMEEQNVETELTWTRQSTRWSPNMGQRRSLGWKLSQHMPCPCDFAKIECMKRNINASNGVVLEKNVICATAFKSNDQNVQLFVPISLRLLKDTTTAQRNEFVNGP